MNTLPLVLLGIRTTLKEDVSITAAEIWHHTALLRELFTASPTNPFLMDPSDYVFQLKAHMQQIHPPAFCPTQLNYQVSETLSTGSHIFIHHHSIQLKGHIQHDTLLTTHLEHVELYFAANNIADDKQTSVLLTVIGTKN